VKFFTPDSSWTWYATEGSPVDENGIMIQPGEDKHELAHTTYLRLPPTAHAVRSQCHLSFMRNAGCDYLR
jgi:hypothetical protein